MKICPCMGCKGRMVVAGFNCHDHCGDFVEWKTNISKNKEYVKKERQRSYPPDSVCKKKTIFRTHSNRRVDE